MTAIAIDEDSRPNLNLNWMYGCVWRMLATVHKHLGALALSSALDHLLRDNVVPSEVLYCLLVSTLTVCMGFSDNVKYCMHVHLVVLASG